MNKNQILEKLKTINYPGFNRDIVSFGMVKDVIIDNSIITIMLSISSQNEEKKNQLVTQVLESIQSEEFEIKNFIDNNYNAFPTSYLVGIASNYSDDIRLYEDISLPSDITVINNLLINRKKNKGDSMIIIGNDIYLYKKNKYMNLLKKSNLIGA